MTSTELNDLELQINQLLHKLDKLKMENLSLRQKLAHCAKERSRLQEVNQQAGIKVKRIITQLKEEIA